MKTIILLRKLEKYPVFNLKTFGEIIGKNRDYAKLVIFRLKKEGLIFEIERNRYTLNKDPLIVASNILWPCYISSWTALRYYNLTEQLPQIIYIMTTRAKKKKEINFNNTKIIFIKIKPKYFFGYKKETYNGFQIFIAEKEKAIIDSALFKKISFSEIFDIVNNNIKNINILLFTNYLIKIKNKALIKRFGFLLYKNNIDIYKKVKKFINFKYISLDYAIKAKGEKNKKWKVIENVEL